MHLADVDTVVCWWASTGSTGASTVINMLCCAVRTAPPKRVSLLLQTGWPGVSLSKACSLTAAAKPTPTAAAAAIVVAIVVAAAAVL